MAFPKNQMSLHVAISTLSGIIKTLCQRQVQHLIAFSCSAVLLSTVDYPYPADFLEPLPPWPINVTCNAILGSLLSDKNVSSAGGQPRPLPVNTDVYLYNSRSLMQLQLAWQSTITPLGPAGLTVSTHLRLPHLI